MFLDKYKVASENRGRELEDRKFSNTIYFWLLFLILIFSFLIRFPGIWFGYPLPVHPDEPRLVQKALNIIHTGDFNPHFFNYPSLNIYLLSIAYTVIAFIGNIFTATEFNFERDSIIYGVESLSCLSLPQQFMLRM